MLRPGVLGKAAFSYVSSLFFGMYSSFMADNKIANGVVNTWKPNASLKLRTCGHISVYNICKHTAFHGYLDSKHVSGPF